MYSSAVLVILVRLATPLQIGGTDLAQQMESALRLSAGQGLTNTLGWPTVPDLNSDPAPVPQTLWPPGLSILIAGLVALDMSLVTSLKLIYTVGTAAGWLGWTSICRRVSGGIPVAETSLIIRGTALIAAFLIPILYTPLWTGTDILLWAGVPWVLFLANRPAGAPDSLSSAAAAGLLVGLLFTFRYASAFLGLAVGIIMLCPPRPNWMELWKRYIAFGLSSLLLTIPILLYMTRGDTVPLGDMYELGVQQSEIITVAKVAPGVGRLIFANQIVELVTARVGWPIFGYMVGLLMILAILIAPVLRWRQSPQETECVELPLLILPAALLIFLIAVSRGFYIGVPRYFEPVLLCWVLVCVTVSRSRNVLLAWGARGVLVVFLAYPLTVALPSFRPSFIRSFLGYYPGAAANLSSESNPITIPGYDRIFAEKNTSRGKLVDLFRQYPDALFLAQRHPMYVYDGLPGGPKPGSQIRPLPEGSSLDTAYSSIDRKVFVVLDTYRNRPQPWKWIRKVVYRNEWENTLICEVDIRAGERLLDAATRMPADGN